MDIQLKVKNVFKKAIIFNKFAEQLEERERQDKAIVNELDKRLINTLLK